MRTVGIVGGLGPETTSDFYLTLIRKFRDSCMSYPSIVIDNVAFPFYLERDIIQKSINEDKLLPFLKESIERLNRGQADFIVIPCNTVHIFIDELRRESLVPIISMVDETVCTIKEKSYKKIGILATTKTIDDKLYETPLAENGIDAIIPTKTEQDEMARIILRILSNKSYLEDKSKLLSVINNLIERGAECILSACTDIQLILKQSDLDVKLIDTLDVLLSATFNGLISDINQNTKIKGR